MPKKPNATKPKANTAGASISVGGNSVLTPNAAAMSSIITSPSQNALMLPATNPDKMFSDAPPSREEMTTSRTWRDSVDVNTFTSSGISAPAKVPHVITVDNFHHSVESP